MDFRIDKYNGWKHVGFLSNDSMELAVALDIGPRVLRFQLKGRQNVFHEVDNHRGLTGEDRWRAYGGHRLWYAPETKAHSKQPDNAPVEHDWDGTRLLLRQAPEPLTGFVKELEITPHETAPQVKVLHRIRNGGEKEMEIAPWAITMMAPGGEAIIPQEPFLEHDESLQPVRPLVLWSYTRMEDARYHWGNELLRIRQDVSTRESTKIGVYHRAGWAAYHLNSVVFLKTIPVIEGATYPDYGCNFEFFTNDEMLEVESLGPLSKLAPGAEVTHEETWSLHQLTVGFDDERDLLALEKLLSRLPK